MRDHELETFLQARRHDACQPFGCSEQDAALRNRQRVYAASTSLRHDLKRLQRRGIEPDRAILFVVDYHEIEPPQHVANLFVRARNFRRHRHRPTSWVIARARATLRRLAYPRWLHREGGPFNPGAGSPLIFLRVPIAPPESPAIPLFPAYLRSFAGVSHRRDLCPTSTNPPLDSCTASPT